jgi:hypothetical protein
MKKLFFIIISLFAFNSFASHDCTYENASTILLSKPLNMALSELGCVESTQAKRAKNHLIVNVLRSRIGDDSSFLVTSGDEILGSASVVNLLNGRVITLKNWYSMNKKFLITTREISAEAFDKQAEKASQKVMRDLAKQLGQQQILE